MTSGSSKRTPALVKHATRSGVGVRDAIAIVLLVALAFLMMAHSVSRRSVELLPWPDGLEYAAQAVNLDDGRGPVLHFGGYSYPSRYPEGYPLILAAALPIIGHDVARLHIVTIALGLVAIVITYLLTLGLFGRPAAVISTLLLALCPIFVTYSTLVLSDVPTMAMTILGAYALARATREESDTQRMPAWYATWVVIGFIAGFSAIMRPTNAMMAGAIVLAMVLVPPSGLSFRHIAIASAGFVLAFVAMPLLQLHSNSVHLGGTLRSGYGWWVPEIYSSSGHPFSAAHLFGPTLPRNPRGNVPVYVATLLGVDGMLGDPGDAWYFLYPFAAAVFAIIGIVAALRTKENPVARRVVIFGLSLLGLLFALYIFDLFTEPAYLLPGVIVVFVTAGYGSVVANRWMRTRFAAARRSIGELAAAGGIAILDALLLVALATQFVIRMNAEPRQSQMVAELERVATIVPPNATIVSNISLQFLELYITGDIREFVGLNSQDPGGTFTDYHLNRLFAKRALGWSGPIPKVLFPSDSMDPAVQRDLTTDAQKGVYLLMAAPESQEYGAVLHDEVDKAQAAFAFEPIIQNQTIALFRLTPQRVSCAERGQGLR